MLVDIAIKQGVFATMNYVDVNVLPSDEYRVYFRNQAQTTLNSTLVSNIKIYAET